MDKLLFLMRHGETLFNKRGKIQGWSDSPLTARGKQQAQIAGKYFENNNIQLDHAYCSTSERAEHTLKIILSHTMHYERDARLKEMNFGEFEGESEVLLPEYKDYNTFFKHYGGESMIQVRERMVSAVSEIMNKADHQNVIIVSHSGACRNFYHNWIDPSLRYYQRFPNCCILIFKYDGKNFLPIDIIEHDFSKIVI